jgi:hypothetical protein
MISRFQAINIDMNIYKQTVPGEECVLGLFFVFGSIFGGSLTWRAQTAGTFVVSPIFIYNPRWMNNIFD